MNRDIHTMTTNQTFSFEPLVGMSSAVDRWGWADWLSVRY